VFGFAGLSMHSDGLAVDPQLPANWRNLSFRIQWRGRRLKIRIDRTKKILESALEAGEPMTLVVSGEPHELRRDQMLRVFAIRTPDGGVPSVPKGRTPLEGSSELSAQQGSRASLDLETSSIV
jgi:Glycosyl hydrolase family 65, C-terminal domain